MYFFVSLTHLFSSSISTCSTDHSQAYASAKSQSNHSRTDHGGPNPPTADGAHDELSHGNTDPNANSTTHDSRTNTASINGQADTTTGAGTDRNSHIPTDTTAHGIANPGTDFAYPRISHRAGIRL